MLEDFYTSLSVYINEETDWDSPPTDEDGTLVLKGTIMGFIQTRGGSYPFDNQALSPQTTHLLYTELGSAIKTGEYIVFDGEYYLIEYIPPSNGISGVEDHMECALVYQNNIVG